MIDDIMKKLLKSILGEEIDVYHKRTINTISYGEFVLHGTLTKHRSDNKYYQVTSLDDPDKHIVFSVSEVFDVVIDEKNGIMLY